MATVTTGLPVLPCVVHAVSAAFWTATPPAVFPPTRAGGVSPAGFERAVDGLLRATR